MPAIIKENPGMESMTGIDRAADASAISVT